MKELLCGTPVRVSALQQTSHRHAETWICGKEKGGRARECVYTSSVCVNGDHRRRRPSRQRRQRPIKAALRTWERERALALASPWLWTDGRSSLRVFESERASRKKGRSRSRPPRRSALSGVRTTFVRARRVYTNVNGLAGPLRH